ncbi:MAG: hypothetical protein M0Z83_01145 [Betaproteobacteria bacterium]|nr:hypothetical protein [Betaproteobacteria bacterium]
MHAINQIPPDRMTPEQRRHEIASLLANGLVRLRTSGTEQSANMTAESEFVLAVPSERSVHRVSNQFI